MPDDALTTQDNAAQPDGGQDWRTELPEDVRLSLDKFKSPADLAQSYVHLEKKLGERPQGLIPPGEDATDEQRAEYTAKLNALNGVPEAPDKYGLDKPEWAEDDQWGNFLAEAHAVGAPPHIVKWMAERTAANRQAEEEAVKKHAQEVADKLTSEWGEDGFKAKLTIGERVLSHLDTLAGLDGKLVQDLEAAGWTNSEHVVRALAALGESLGESNLKGGGGKLTGLPSKAELNKMRLDPRYADPAKRDQEYVKEVDAQWDRVYGDAPYEGGPVSARLS